VRIDTTLITVGKRVYIFDEADIQRALLADIRIKKEAGKRIDFSWQGHYGEQLTATITITDEEEQT